MNDINEMLKAKLNRTLEMREDIDIEVLKKYVGRLHSHYCMQREQETVLIDYAVRTILLAVEQGIEIRDMLHYNRFIASQYYKENCAKIISYKVREKLGQFKY